MTRPLLLTAALGLVASIACFAVAWGLGGFHWRHGITLDTDHVFDGGPTITRDLAWSGGDTLSLAAPADLTFTQGPTTRITVTGPKGAAATRSISPARVFTRRPRMR